MKVKREKRNKVSFKKYPEIPIIGVTFYDIFMKDDEKYIKIPAEMHRDYLVGYEDVCYVLTDYIYKCEEMPLDRFVELFKYKNIDIITKNNSGRYYVTEDHLEIYGIINYYMERSREDDYYELFICDLDETTPCGKYFSVS